MKFGKQLERHKVNGWEAFYVDYNGLKRSLKGWYGGTKHQTAKDGASSSEGSPRAERELECEVSASWMEELQASIDRVNEFFTSIADEAELRLSAGQEELKQAFGSGHEPQLRLHLRSMATELQSTMLDLSHFASANHTAVYKILKKHDKQSGLCTLPSMLQQVVKEPFNNPGKARLESIQRQLKEFADKLGVDSDLQMKSPHDKSTTENLWALARMSYSLGVISMALIVLAVLSGMEPQINHFSVEDLAATIPVLRLSFMMNLTAWLAGGCACVFERCRINYMFLLDISPDLDVSAMSLLNYASVQTGVWIVLTFCFLADMKFGAVLFNLHPEIHKLGWSLAHIYSSSVLILQFAITSSWVSVGARRLFSRLAWRVCCFSLLGEVSFAENIFADFLTSLGRPLKDGAYTLCYFRNWRSFDVQDIRVQCKQDTQLGLAWALLQLVLVMPLLFRIAQCVRRMRDTGDRGRHLLNCGKYSLAIVVSLLAAVHVLPLGLTPFQFNVVRVLSYLAATSYAATWDLVVDFGLMVHDRRCLYPRYTYGILAGMDVALRSTWLLTYQPDCRAFVGASTFNRECFAFMISSLELIRRAIWATVRIEHEHQSNAGRFRSVCWVPPLEHRRPMVMNSGTEFGQKSQPTHHVKAALPVQSVRKRNNPRVVAVVSSTSKVQGPQLHPGPNVPDQWMEPRMSAEPLDGRQYANSHEEPGGPEDNAECMLRAAAVPRRLLWKEQCAAA